MNIDQIVGHCTADKLKALAGAAIANLSDEDLFAVLDNVLSDNQKEELATRYAKGPEDEVRFA